MDQDQAQFQVSPKQDKILQHLEQQEPSQKQTQNSGSEHSEANNQKKSHKKSITSEFTQEQHFKLENIYKVQKFFKQNIPAQEKEALLQELNLSEQQILAWFGNRRRKEQRVEKAIGLKLITKYSYEEIKQAILNYCSNQGNTPYTNSIYQQVYNIDHNSNQNINDIILVQQQINIEKAVQQLLEEAKSIVPNFQAAGPQLGIFFDEIENITDSTKDFLNNFPQDKAQVGVPIQHQINSIATQVALNNPTQYVYLNEGGKGKAPKSKKDQSQQELERQEREEQRKHMKDAKEQEKEQRKSIKEKEREDKFFYSKAQQQEREDLRNKTIQEKEDMRLKISSDKEQKRHLIQQEKERKLEQKKREFEDKKREREQQKQLEKEEKKGPQRSKYREGYQGPYEDEELELQKLCQQYGISPTADGNLDIHSQIQQSPPFPPDNVILTSAFGPNLGDHMGPEFLIIWKFLFTFHNVFGVQKLSVDELLHGISLGQKCIQLSQWIVNVLRVVLVDACIAYSYIKAQDQPNDSYNFTYRNTSNLGSIISEGIKWGFDVDSWRGALNIVTWPEIIRQIAIAASYGQRRPKTGSEVRKFRFQGVNENLEGFEGIEGEDVLELNDTEGLKLRQPSRFHIGSIKAAVWNVLARSGPDGATVNEITLYIQQWGLRDLSFNKKPEASVAVALSRDVVFVRLAPGRYALQAVFAFHRRLKNLSEDTQNKDQKINSQTKIISHDNEVQDIILAPNYQSKETTQIQSVEGKIGNNEVSIQNSQSNNDNDKSIDIKSDIENLSDDQDSDHNSNSDNDIENDTQGIQLKGIKQSCIDTYRLAWIQSLQNQDFDDLSFEVRISILSLIVDMALSSSTVRQEIDYRNDELQHIKKLLTDEFRAERKRRQAEHQNKIKNENTNGQDQDNTSQVLKQSQNINNTTNNNNINNCNNFSQTQQEKIQVKQESDQDDVTSRGNNQAQQQEKTQQNIIIDIKNDIKTTDNVENGIQNHVNETEGFNKEPLSHEHKKKRGRKRKSEVQAQNENSNQQDNLDDQDDNKGQKSQLSQTYENLLKRIKLESFQDINENGYNLQDIEKQRQQYYQEVIKEVEELFIYRQEVLGVDRRYNRYWRLLRPKKQLTSNDNQYNNNVTYQADNINQLSQENDRELQINSTQIESTKQQNFESKILQQQMTTVNDLQHCSPLFTSDHQFDSNFKYSSLVLIENHKDGQLSIAQSRHELQKLIEYLEARGVREGELKINLQSHQQFLVEHQELYQQIEIKDIVDKGELDYHMQQYLKEAQKLPTFASYQTYSLYKPHDYSKIQNTQQKNSYLSQGFILQLKLVMDDLWQAFLSGRQEDSNFAELSYNYNLFINNIGQVCDTQNLKVELIKMISNFVKEDSEQIQVFTKLINNRTNILNKLQRKLKFQDRNECGQKGDKQEIKQSYDSATAHIEQETQKIMQQQKLFVDDIPNTQSAIFYSLLSLDSSMQYIQNFDSGKQSSFQYRCLFKPPHKKLSLNHLSSSYYESVQTLNILETKADGALQQYIKPDQHEKHFIQRPLKAFSFEIAQDNIDKEIDANQIVLTTTLPKIKAELKRQIIQNGSIEYEVPLEWHNINFEQKLLEQQEKENQATQQQAQNGKDYFKQNHKQSQGASHKRKSAFSKSPQKAKKKLRLKLKPTKTMRIDKNIFDSEDDDNDDNQQSSGSLKFNNGNSSDEGGSSYHVK